MLHVSCVKDFWYDTLLLVKDYREINESYHPCGIVIHFWSLLLIATLWSILLSMESQLRYRRESSLLNMW